MGYKKLKKPNEHINKQINKKFKNIHDNIRRIEKKKQNYTKEITLTC